MQKKKKARGEKAALLALVGITIIFIGIVGRGWHTLFLSLGETLALLVGLGMALIAVVLGYAIASERVNNEGARVAAAAYFFVLFNISALGTINAMFVMFQSGDVFREHADKAADAVVALKETGVPLIDTRDYDRFKAQVGDKWRNLKAELENPQLCGQGAVAAARISELQSLLPNFRPLAGGGGRCEKVPAVVASYEQQIATLEKASPVYQANKAKIELKQKILADSDKLLSDLKEIRTSLSGNYSLSSVKSRLYPIAEHYGVLRQELASVATVSTEKVQQKIEMRTVAALGNIGQVIPFIMSRLAEPSTYIYLIVALVVDLALIAAFVRVLQFEPTSAQRQRSYQIRKV